MESPKSYAARPGITVSKSMTQTPRPVFASSSTLFSFVSLCVTRRGISPAASASISTCTSRSRSRQNSISQTPRFIARYGVLKLLIARRRIVEIADGFKERIRGEAANLPLEASKRLAGKLK